MAFPTTLRERLAGAGTAIAVQAGLFALLALSLAVVRRLPQEQETILTLPPLPRPLARPAMVIDARPPLRPSTAPPPPVTPLFVPPSPAPAAPQAVPDAALLRDLGKSLAACRPDRYNDPSLHCPPPAIPDANNVNLHPPSGVKDEAHWQAEMARKNAPPDAGIAVGPGIGVVISDPLCKLAWVLMGGGFKCGPPAPARASTEAQFKAALAAANASRRALYSKPVLASPGTNGDSHAKEGISGGADAGLGAAAGAASPSR